MNMAIITLLIMNVIIIYFIYELKNKRQDNDLFQTLKDISKSLNELNQNLKDEFRTNRAETATNLKENREELNNSIKELKFELTSTLDKMTNLNRDSLDKVSSTLKENNKELKGELVNSLTAVQQNFDRNVESFNNLQKEKFEQLTNKQDGLVQSTEKKLEEMRVTVDEKLSKTLNERLGQSFETVGKQLIAVQEGLGEMKTIANDVGGLKKVLGNVKMRGGIGEVQLSMLLEQILAPNQYEANVKTKKGSSDLVEFAIKLPGKEEGLEHVWLPIDAKFPKDYYEQLQLAHDNGDMALIEKAQKELETAVVKMAKDISSKYIDPPNTTDFGIMFLPFEGIYAEVVRKASLLDELQKEHKIIVTGPSTLAALLNSLQMGFRTLAIQKRSSEVWQVLGAVKTEFDKFGGLLDKAHKNIHSGLEDLEKLAGTRTNVIRRKLKSIEALSESDSKMVLPDLMNDDIEDET